jgi:hypothetical protein
MGDSMSTIINATTTNGVVIQPDNSGSLVLQTNSGTTALTIDTSQRASFVAGTAALPAITTTGDTNTGIFFPAADTIAFAEGGAESMRIDSSGNLMVGTTSLGFWPTKLTLSTNSGTTEWSVGPTSTPQDFIIAATASSGVYLAGTAATSWTAVSDERHKDIIENIENGLDKVCSLRAVIGKYKQDETNTRKPFLFAQDVLKVLPEAVDTRNQDRFGLSYTDTIPLLVAAIQEQQTIINDLKARVETLEAK